jgi:hypothetical protein
MIIKVYHRLDQELPKIRVGKGKADKDATVKKAGGELVSAFADDKGQHAPLGLLYETDDDHAVIGSFPGISVNSSMSIRTLPDGQACVKMGTLEIHFVAEKVAPVETDKGGKGK